MGRGVHREQVDFGAKGMAKLIELLGGRIGTEVPIKGRTFKIGRSEDCDYCLGDSRVSRIHATIEWDEGTRAFTIRDGDGEQRSSHGTVVNGHPIGAEPRPLCHRDVIVIVSTQLEFVDEEQPGKAGARKRRAVPTTEGEAEILGGSPEIGKLIENLNRVALLDVSVFLKGERGSGKELAARRIHYFSTRKQERFHEVNMAGLDDGLVNATLFGHEEGAFTSADRARQGVFEIANNGTLFLDEIGRLPLAAQPKLLRVLQDRRVFRIGSDTAIEVNVRVIAATNQNLVDMVEDGEFLPDLYDRIMCAAIIEIPPLRVRDGDVELLARHFAKQWEVSQFRGRRFEISDSAMTKLREHEFPGNVRELDSVMFRALFEADCRGAHVVEADHICFEGLQKRERMLQGALAAQDEDRKGELKAALEKLGGTLEELKYLYEEALSERGHSQKAIAKRFGVDRGTVKRMREARIQGGRGQGGEGQGG